MALHFMKIHHSVLCSEYTYLNELEKHKPANKPSPSLLKWFSLITSTCHSKFNDMELGQYRSHSGPSVDTATSSNGTQTVHGHSIFILCERKPDSSIQFARVRFATGTGVDTALLPSFSDILEASR